MQESTTYVAIQRTKSGGQESFSERIITHIYTTGLAVKEATHRGGEDPQHTARVLRTQHPTDITASRGIAEDGAHS